MSQNSIEKNVCQQFVTIGNTKSETKPVEQGVPQGSLLGPRFYSYHANDLPDAVKQPIENQSDEDGEDEAEMFADDTTEFSIADSIDKLIPKIQKASNSLHNWSILNSMVIHPGKTKVMIVSKRKFIGPIQNITMGGRDLEIVENQKVLGVTIDNSMTWKFQLEKVLKHFRSKIKMLKRMSVLGQKVTTKFYYSAIIPSIIYNITIWGNSDTTIKNLNELHAKAAKVIYWLPNHLSNEEALRIVGWMTMDYIYKRRLLCLMHKVYYKNIDPEILKMFLVPDEKSPQRRDYQIKISLDFNANNCNAFTKKASKIWNAMPNELTGTKNYNSFLKKLPQFKSKIEKFSFVYNSYNIDDDFIFIQ